MVTMSYLLFFITVFGAIGIGFSLGLNVPNDFGRISDEAKSAD